MTAEALLALLPQLIQLLEVIFESHSNGADPKAPLSDEHQAAANSAIAAIAAAKGATHLT
jgi:hypothetical protein